MSNLPMTEQMARQILERKLKSLFPAFHVWSEDENLIDFHIADESAAKYVEPYARLFCQWNDSFRLRFWLINSQQPLLSLTTYEDGISWLEDVSSFNELRDKLGAERAIKMALQCPE